MIRREGSLGPNQIRYCEEKISGFKESRAITERVRAETEASRAKVTPAEAERPGVSR